MILLVDDNEVNRKVAKSMLEHLGHRTEIVENGKQAVDVLANSPAGAFDLVLMDIQMPQLDGLSATRQIRERERKTNRHQLVVALTAHAIKGDRQKCLEAGMDGYIAKPMRVAELELEIERVMSGARVERECRAENSLKQASLAAKGEPLCFDAQELRQRVQGSVELMAELIRIFLDDTPKQLSELQQAVVARDQQRVERVAHTIKGAASVIAAKGLAGAARALEMAARSNAGLDAQLISRITAEWDAVRPILENEKSAVPV